MNNEYRLQLLSHGQIFPTREEAVEYIEDNFKGEALWSEPAVFFYGTERDPKMILAVGASKSATRPRICTIDDAELRELIAAVQEATDDNTEKIENAAKRILEIVNAVGLTYDENKINNQISYDPDSRDALIGQAQSVAEAVAIISTFIQSKFKENELTIVDGKSIDFDFTKTDDGSTLTAEVKISEDGSDDELNFNDNIVGLKPDGVFASCNIEYDSERNRLIFTTSGIKNGRFVTDANRKIIDFGAHTIYTADNEDHNVQLVINQDTHKISADVKIAEDEWNLLQNHSGRLLVDGRAKNIKYKGTTVADQLNAYGTAINEIKDKIEFLELEDLIEGDESDTILTKAIKKQNGGYTISADVRLSSDDSIQVANGGLKANVDIIVDSTNNKLILKVGNNEKVISLPGVSILDDIYYDSANKVIVITWKDGTQQTIIPVGDMLKTWIIENNQLSPVVLTKTESSVSGQPEVLSADLKIAQTDNLIGKDAYGQIYVRKSEIDNKIDAEKTAREAADNELNNLISTTSQTLSERITEEANTRHQEDDDIRDSINNVRTEAANALSNAVEEINDKIDDTKGEIYSRIDSDENRIAQVESGLTLTNANLESEISRATTAETANTDAINAEVTRATGVENAIANRVTSLESGLATERETRNTADAVHDEQISNLRSAVTSAEQSHREDIERLSSEIEENAGAIAIINGSESVSGSIREAVKTAKDEATQMVANEKSRAETAEQRLEILISNEVSRATQGEADTLATSKAYTDHAVADSKHLSDDYTDAAKLEAINTSKEYTDSKFESAETSSNEYTDTAVAAEKARAEAAETANAEAIIELKAKDLELESELANKIESVTVVKNSQSDLQYILKVDGVDAGEINIPKDQFLESVSYNPVSKELTFNFETSAGLETTVINVSDLVDTYLAGDGLVLNENKFTVKINPASEYLSVDADGVKVSGINDVFATKANITDVYTKAEADAKFLTEHQDVSNLATKTELNTETARATAAEQTNANEIAGLKAKDIEIDNALAEKVEDVKIVKGDTDLIYRLIVDGEEKGTINIPEDQFLKSVNYSPATKELTFVFDTREGEKIVVIAVDDLVDTYTAGNGLKLENNKFSIVINEDTESYLSLTAEGLKVSGIDAALATKANANNVYTKAEADEKFLTEHQDISGLATKVEVNDAITALNAKDVELETEVNKKIESVEVEKNSANELQYIIKVDGTNVGTIDIPKDQFLKEVVYDAGNKAIVFTFETSEGVKIVNVNVDDLVDTYTAGNGLKVENNVFSVVINEDSEAYLTLTPEGLKISGIDAALATKANAADVYTKTESDAKYITEHQDISGLATKVEVNEVAADVEANTNAISVINGNEAQVGSIKKALADAKVYTDDKILAEKNRAEAAETANADAISILNGNEAQVGSVKNAIKVSEDYTDDKIAEVNTHHDTDIAAVNAALDNKANKSEVYTKSEIDTKGFLTSTDIAGLASSEDLATETTRATAAENAIANDLATANSNITTNTSDITDLKREATRLNLIVDETNSIKLIKSKDDNGTELSADVKLDITGTNILKITGNGLTADVEMSYSQATNTITFSNGLTTQEFQLAGASLIEDGFYDSTTRQIVLITRLSDGTTREIRINADALIHTLKVDNGVQNPIKLAKTTDAEGVDVLSARLDISTESHNLILNNNGTLYASNEAKNHTGLWGGEEKTIQYIIEKLKTEIDKIPVIENEVTEIRNEVDELSDEVGTYSSRISSLESSVVTLTGLVNEINGRVSDIQSEFETYKTNTDNRLGVIEEILDNLIDFGEE